MTRDEYVNERKRLMKILADACDSGDHNLEDKTFELLCKLQDEYYGVDDEQTD